MYAHRGLSKEEHLAMRLVIDKALDAAASGDGRAGIAAAILRDGILVGSGANHVILENNPTRHAEIVAIERASETLGRSDLKDCILLSSLQPCEMCLAAARFSGIRRILFGARKRHVARKYFAFPHMEIDQFIEAEDPIEVVGGLFEEEVLHLYADGRE
mgnify:FL=1